MLCIPHFAAVVPRCYPKENAIAGVQHSHVELHFD